MRLVIALITLIATLQAAQAAEPFARATVEDDGRIVPGRQVHVTIDVFVPDFFVSPPQFPLFDLPDAMVTLPEERAQNLVQTIDEVQYSGIRRRYSVVPETTGTFTLPQIEIEFGYSQNGKPVRAKVTVPPVSFNVAGASGSASTLAFAARGLTMMQSFDRDPAKLTAGEALVRTITIFASDTQAMMIPPPDIGVERDVAEYRAAPQIKDGVPTDGATGSTRTETITYVTEKPGTVVLPAATLTWFDIDAHQQQSARLDPVMLTVATAPAQSQSIAPPLATAAPERQMSSLRVLAIPLGVALAAAGMFWAILKSRPRLSAMISQWSLNRHTSEKARFNALMASMQSGDAVIYQKLEEWCKSAGFKTIAAWLDTTDDAELREQITRLERSLYGPEEPSDVSKPLFAKALRRQRQGKRLSASVKQQSLPPLNPIRR